MDRVSAAQQAGGFGDIAQNQAMHRRSRQLLPTALDFPHLGQFGPAAAAGLGAAELSAANRAALHESGLEIEE